MYCEAIHILMSDEISHENLLKAHSLFNNLVALTENLYGKRAMTFNVHQLTHLAQSVADFGLLGEHNGYPFESGNGEILKSVHSGKGVIDQICRNVNMGTPLKTIENGIQRDDSPAVQFCRSLKKTETVKSLEETNVESIIACVNRDACIVPQKKISERSDNSHVQLKNGSFIEVSSFVADRFKDKLYIAAKNINVQRVHNFTFLNKITEIDGDLFLVDSAEIQKICFYLELNDSRYIIPVPTMTTYS
ncbi:hypothetical protein QAD02_001225 [Eretmocerus hayati]|uniref:Uncharacterized protein n=1 Tax=Eretmocerus hayati TaxID=131215 RepID=A0ACC2NFV8_9HYME|nr:hypothetical protein QAD02_001225 [Eretmocerus hayati]